MSSIPLMISAPFSMSVMAAQIAALDPLMITCALVEPRPNPKAI
jgi:hypothetical protein